MQEREESRVWESKAGVNEIRGIGRGIRVKLELEHISYSDRKERD